MFLIIKSYLRVCLSSRETRLFEMRARSLVLRLCSSGSSNELPHISNRLVSRVSRTIVQIMAVLGAGFEQHKD